ncbi:hypothetical protein HZC30_07455 [Candidatus Woesearchaeota archaeon]|nr:hypothetical protein [Candidatus Woesearchaeota archaeon]
MVLDFERIFMEALSHINYKKEHHEFPIHEDEEDAAKHDFDGIIQRYGEMKWKVVDLLNGHYSEVLKDKFDHYNWLNHNEQDELAYFLNEAGSNCLNHSEYKAPYKFHVWLGHKGFIVGIEQKGRGFPAHKVHHQKIKSGEGAAFEFFRKSKSRIFFDDPHDARMVFMEFKFE